MASIYGGNPNALWADPTASVQTIGQKLKGNTSPFGGLSSMVAGQTSGQPGPPSGAMVAPTMAPQSGVTTSPWNVPAPPPNVPRLPQVFGGATGNVQGVTQFGPGQSLIGTQINPTIDPRLTNVQGATDRARDRYTGFDEGKYGPIAADMSQSQGVYDELLKLARSGGTPASYYGGASGVPSALQGRIDDLTSKVSAPDRAKLAGDTFDILSQRAQPGRDRQVRELGQRTAALGRVGSGIYGSNLTDLQTNFNTEDALSKRQLATEAAGQTLDDQLRSLQALRAVGGDYASAYGGAVNSSRQADNDRFERLLTVGRDLTGREGDVYGRGVNEREFATGRESELYGRRRGEFSDLGAEEDRISREGRLNRDELRGERGYQGGLERDATSRRIDQRAAEEQYLDAEERRRLAAATAIGGAVGEAPTGLLSGVGAQQSAQGTEAIAGAGDWLAQYLAQKQLAKRPEATMPVDLRRDYAPPRANYPWLIDQGGY